MEHHQAQAFLFLTLYTIQWESAIQRRERCVGESTLSKCPAREMHDRGVAMIVIIETDEWQSSLSVLCMDPGSPIIYSSPYTLSRQALPNPGHSPPRAAAVTSIDWRLDSTFTIITMNMHFQFSLFNGL